MDRAWTRWSVTALSIAVAGMLGVGAMNSLIDPYEIFRTSQLRPGVTVNDRYGKIEHLLANPGRYNGLILGSSVMGVFNPSVADQQLPGRRFYNLSYFGGTPEEALNTLKALEAKGFMFTDVIMGLDAFAFMEGKEAVDLSRRPHPVVSGESRTAFLLSYLTAPSFMQCIGKLAHDRQEVPSIVFDLSGNGQYHLAAFDREISEDPVGFTKRHVSDPAKVRRLSRSGAGLAPAKIESFATLNQWLTSRGIASRFFINPMTSAMRQEVGEANVEALVRHVSAISGEQIPDFSHLAEDGDASFYDLKHIRPSVATDILGKILAPKSL